MKKTVIENQSVLDTVTQFLGNPEAAFAFCMQNNLSLTEDLFSGQIVEIGENIEQNTGTSKYFSEKKIQLATGRPILEMPAFGIGEMIIEQTFIIG